MSHGKIIVAAGAAANAGALRPETKTAAAAIKTVCFERVT
jgi:hypothetical protein